MYEVKFNAIVCSKNITVAITRRIKFQNCYYPVLKTFKFEKQFSTIESIFKIRQNCYMKTAKLSSAYMY